MNRTNDHEPPSAFSVFRNDDGRYGVFGRLGAAGGVMQWYATEAEAQGRADRAKDRYHDHMRQAANRSARATASAMPSPAPTPNPTPNPTPSAPPSPTSPGGANPMAFQVAGFGENVDGFVTFDEHGKVDKTFGKRKDAERHAADRKAAHDARQAGTASTGATAPPPSAGTAGVPVTAPKPAQSAAATAASMGSAPPVATASPASTPQPPPNPTPLGVRSPGTPAAPASASASAFAGARTPSPTAVAGARAARGSSTGRSAMADAFERAFDASIGKAISGSEKIVTNSLDAFKRGYAGVKSGMANPGAAFASAGSAFGRASFSSQVVAAFAMARAKGIFGSAVGGVGSAFSGAASSFGSAFRKGGAAFRKGVRSPGATARAAVVAARNAARKAAGAAKRAGSAFGSSAKRAGTGFRRAGGAAFRAAGRVSAGAAMGSPGLYATALTAIPKLLQAFSEHQLGANRPLAQYSGEMSHGFARLGLNDQLRSINLARSAAGTANTLIGQVDVLRQGQNGIDKLSMGVMNRAGILAAGLAAPAFREIGRMADAFNDKIEKVDPKGEKTKGLADTITDGLAGAAGWIGGLATTGSIAAANNLANETIKDLERERGREAERLLGGDGWSELMLNARTLPKLNPPRPVPR